MNKKKKFSDIFTAQKEKNDYYSFSSTDPLKDISQFYEMIRANNINIIDFKLKETSLEEVFIHLIKKDILFKNED